MRKKYGLLVVAMTLLPALSHAERVALVIGNQKYTHFSELANPVSDAAKIDKALRGLGFDVAEFRQDLTQDEFKKVLDSFRQRAASAEAAVVYYAGHGMSNDKATFLMPVDAKVTQPGDLEAKGIPVEMVLDSIKDAGTKVVIVDACRTRLRGTDPNDRGLGRTTQAAGLKNYLIAYAAEIGQAAGDNSSYASVLAAGLGQRNKSIMQVFDDVSDSVKEKTGALQTPMRYGDLRVDRFLVPPTENTFRLGNLFTDLVRPDPAAANGRPAVSVTITP